MAFTAAETEIANLTLGHLGVLKPIGELETENSAEARACRQFFQMARDMTLRDFDWPFARRVDTLSEVEEDPNDAWGYSYRVPSDCVAVRSIFNDSRLEDEANRIPFQIYGDDSGGLIYTDQEDAEVVYTKRITNGALCPLDFIMAMSLRLGVYIAPAVSGGDPYGLGKRCYQLYMDELSQARANALNERCMDVLPDSDSIRARL